MDLSFILALLCNASRFDKDKSILLAARLITLGCVVSKEDGSYSNIRLP